MARLLPVKSPERKEFLTKAIAAYRRTLAIDSEDVAAHYGLGLAFGDPAWGARTLEAPEAAAGRAGRPSTPTSCSSSRPSIADREGGRGRAEGPSRSSWPRLVASS